MNMINTKDWPNIATRSRWSRILGIPLQTLVYNWLNQKLAGSKEDYYVMHTKEQILAWLKKTHRMNGALH